MELEKLTLERAKVLKHGEFIFIARKTKVENLPPILERWKVTGKVKLWKRSPDRVQVPIKHGMYSYGYLTEKSMDFFEIEKK
jgi:hypothetical protein